LSLFSSLTPFIRQLSEQQYPAAPTFISEAGAPQDIISLLSAAEFPNIQEPEDRLAVKDLLF
jgi:hypothetical protein